MYIFMVGPKENSPNHFLESEALLGGLPQEKVRLDNFMFERL
jgi:hypothetical protein